MQAEMDECMAWPERSALIKDHDVDVGVGEGWRAVERGGLCGDNKGLVSCLRAPRPGHIAG